MFYILRNVSFSQRSGFFLLYIIHLNDDGNRRRRKVRLKDRRVKTRNTLRRCVTSDRAQRTKERRKTGVNCEANLNRNARAVWRNYYIILPPPMQNVTIRYKKKNALKKKKHRVQTLLLLLLSNSYAYNPLVKTSICVA